MCTGAEVAPVAAEAGKGVAEVATAAAMEDAAMGAGMTALSGGLGAAESLAAISAAEAAVGGAAAASVGTGIISGLKTAATVLSPVMSLMQAASGIGESRRMSNLGGASTISPSIVMPVGGGPIAFQARQSSLTSNLRRRGRTATILTAPGDAGAEKLGS